MPIKMKSQTVDSEERLRFSEHGTDSIGTRKVHEVLKVFGHKLHAITALDSDIDIRIVFVDLHTPSHVKYDLATSSRSIVIVYHDFCLRGSRDLRVPICIGTAARLPQMFDQAMHALEGSVTS